MDSNRQTAATDEPTLLDGVAVLLRYWKRVALATLLGALLLLGYGLLQQRRYTSRVVMVPSSAGGGDSRAQAIAAQLRLPGIAGIGGQGGSSQLLVQSILRSQALRDSVSARVRALRGKDAVPTAALPAVLRTGLAVESDPNTRSASVTVTAPDPRLAAAVAGQVPEAVNSIVNALAVETAVRRREGLDRQVDDARRQLAQSENRLRAFQERHGIPDVQEQARQTVDASAELRQQISQAEVRVAMLARTSTPDNPQYRAAVAQLETLRGQLSRMGSERGDLLLSRGAIPEIRLEAQRLMREYTKDEQVYLAVTAEMAGVQADVGQDLAVVSVLDRPEVPEAPSGPRLGLLAIAGAMLGLTLGVAAAFVSDYFRRARTAPEYQDFFSEWDHVRGAALRGRGGNGRTRQPAS
ncbi:MAG TPA: GNVR domain-containing protein [Longimicrobium sp.]|nr:GNVR domain-containing protein [Longimicrobium sp.]